MNDNDHSVLTVMAYFALLSVFAIGGANATIPDMHRVAVDVRGWMTDREFADMFAISQIAPGPNVLIVTLIGYHVAGLSGALAATLSMCGPAALLSYYVSRSWDRARNLRWRTIIMAALVPISVGLMAASAFRLIVTIDHTWQAAALSLLTAIVGYFAKFNPLWMLLAGGILGAAGLVG